jgi:hypothetical protein
MELRDDAEPTALANQLVASVPESVRYARAGSILVRALELCRSGDYARARRLLIYLSTFNFAITAAYQAGFLRGRTGCWEAAATGSAEPGFLAVDRWSDDAIAALKTRFRGARVLQIQPWSYDWGPGDRFARSARAFGLTSEMIDTHDWMSGRSPGEAAARLQGALDAFRPDLLVYWPLEESGVESALADAVLDQTSRVLEDARRQHGLRVAACVTDIWRLPLERMTTRLGRSLDLVQHCHPRLNELHPGLDTRKVWCYFPPTVIMPPSVQPGTVPRACMAGSVNAANTARIVWWAEFGLRDLPVDVVETSFFGDEQLSAQRYSDVLCEHQLVVNITRRLHGVPIVTGRSMETLLAGGVLVEENSVDTRYFLRPGIDYLPFETWTDLTELVPALLGDPARRRRLAESGRRWVERHFTGDWFWAGLLDRLYPDGASPRRASTSDQK